MRRPSYRLPGLRAHACCLTFLLLNLGSAGQASVAADQPVTASSAEALAQAQHKLRVADENMQRAEQRAKTVQKRLQEAESAQKEAQRKAEEAQAKAERARHEVEEVEAASAVAKRGYDDARAVIEKIYQSRQGSVR